MVLIEYGTINNKIDVSNKFKNINIIPKGDINRYNIIGIDPCPHIVKSIFIDGIEYNENKEINLITEKNKYIIEYGTINNKIDVSNKFKNINIIPKGDINRYNIIGIDPCQGIVKSIFIDGIEYSENKEINLRQIHIPAKKPEIPAKKLENKIIERINSTEIRYINFITYTSKYGKFYYDKLIKNINNLNKNNNYIIKSIDTNYFLFNNNNCNDINNFISIKDFLEINSQYIYIFDEILYSHLLACYINFRQFRNMIKTFLENSKYIVLFCEIFENDNLQTIGNNTFNIEFSKLYFTFAFKIFMCNSNNINLLSKQNINNNIIYFPPICYEDKTLILNNDKKIDILIYGNGLDLFEYRINVINKIKKYCNNKKYNLYISDDLHDNILNEKLSNCKIVIHIPSFENLQTFPWAKCMKLFNNNIFILIDKNNEIDKVNKQGLNVATYDNIDNDIYVKIDKYLHNEYLRNIHIESCNKFVKTHFNINKFLTLVKTIK